MRLDCNYITIHVYDNKYFDNLTLFVKEHFDTVENKNSVIVIADFIYNPVSYYRKLYPYKKIIFYNWEQMVSNNTYFDIEKMVENIKGVVEIISLAMTLYLTSPFKILKETTMKLLK